MIKRSIHREAVTMINIYAPNIEAPTYIKQALTELKGEIKNDEIITEDFITALSATSRSFRRGISKETVDLENTVDHTAPMATHRTPPCQQQSAPSSRRRKITTEESVSSSSHARLKTSLRKLQIEIRPSVFSDCVRN